MTWLILVFVVGGGYVYVMNRHDKKNKKVNNTKKEIIEKYWCLYNLLDLETIDSKLVMELFKMREEELQNAER